MLMLKAILLMENKDQSGGVASEKWFLNYSGDQQANFLMNNLMTKRATFMSPGAMVRACRGEVVDFDADGLPKRNHTLQSVGIITGGVSGSLKATSYAPLSSIPEGTGGGRNTGPSLTLNYVNPWQNARRSAIPFCPLGSFADASDLGAIEKFEMAFNQGPIRAAIASYYTFLIRNGANQLVRKTNSTPYPIVSVTSGDPTIPLLATVTVKGDLTAILSTGKYVIVAQRRARKGYGQSRDRELNGTHTVASSDFNATTGMTTLSLTCTTNTTVDLCRSAGNIRLRQYTLLPLAKAEFSSNARARRSRKNTVQI